MIILDRVRKRNFKLAITFLSFISFIIKAFKTTH